MLSSQVPPLDTAQIQRAVAEQDYNLEQARLNILLIKKQMQKRADSLNQNKQNKQNQLPNRF